MKIIAHQKSDRYLPRIIINKELKASGAMPKKIRELKAIAKKAGYVLQPGRGKGSHTFWKHPLLPDEPLTIPGQDGDDAPLYLERGIERVMRKLAELEKLENEENKE